MMINKPRTSFYRSVKWTFLETIGRLRSTGKQKIFGIGYNKTGTTSLKAAMEELGYIVGHQKNGERLVNDWAVRDFSRIVKYSKSAQFFQDIPYSYPYTFIVVDHEFPGSKFILTVRDDPDQWYDSITKYHSKLWGKNGKLPDKEDLESATYIEKGWPWVINRLSYETSEDDLYNKDILIQNYINYNNNVKTYFRHRSKDLLVLNVSEKNAYQELCGFLNVEPIGITFPWKNKTNEDKTV